MINAEFVKAIEMLTREATEPRFYNEFGINYSDITWSPIVPPQASELTVSTLTAIATYCQRLREDGTNCTIQIKSPTCVTLMSNLHKVYRSREEFLMAKCANTAFSFGHDHRMTEFIVALQSQFIESENSKLIMKTVGNISADSKIQSRDDGVTQTVEARVGIARAPETVALPNPIELQPFRTFPEIEQPISKFVIRIKHDDRHGFTAALHEADGGAWKIEAIARIKAWFELELADLIATEEITVLG